MQVLDIRILNALSKREAMTLSQMRRLFHRLPIADRDKSLLFLEAKEFVTKHESINTVNGKTVTKYMITQSGKEYMLSQLGEQTS